MKEYFDEGVQGPCSLFYRVNPDQFRIQRDFEDYTQANVAASVPRFRDTLELLSLADRSFD
ncbi:MAG: hypothetical protein WB992_10670 [Bryobacteraceae bacterium]